MNGREKKEAVTYHLVGVITAAVIATFMAYTFVMAQVDEEIKQESKRMEITVKANKEAIMETKSELTSRIKESEERIAGQIKTLIQVLSRTRPDE